MIAFTAFVAGVVCGALFATKAKSWAESLDPRDPGHS